MKVLVADEHRDQCLTMSVILRLMGHQVWYCFDADATVHDCLMWLPDVAIIDLDMPGLNGFDICRTIKAWEQTRNIFVVATTDNDGIEYRQRGWEAGIDAYLVKPWTDPDKLKHLLSCVNRHKD